MATLPDQRSAIDTAGLLPFVNDQEHFTDQFRCLRPFHRMRRTRATLHDGARSAPRSPTSAPCPSRQLGHKAPMGKEVLDAPGRRFLSASSAGQAPVLPATSAAVRLTISSRPADQVAQCVDGLAHISLARPAAPRRHRQQRLNRRPLHIRQITWAAPGFALDLLPLSPFSGPHSRVTPQVAVISKWALKTETSSRPAAPACRASSR